MAPYTSKPIQHSFNLMSQRFLSTTRSNISTCNNKHLHYCSSFAKRSHPFNQYPKVYSITPACFTNQAVEKLCFVSSNTPKRQYAVAIPRNETSKYHGGLLHNNKCFGDDATTALLLNTRRCFNSTPILFSNDETQNNSIKDDDEDSSNGKDSYTSFFDDDDDDDDNDDNHIGDMGTKFQEQNRRDYYPQRRNNPQSQRNALIHYTHDIMRNTPIGSMSRKQMEDVRTLIYKWYATINSKNSNNINNNIPNHKVRDTALIMESLLERLIEEYDEGLNEDALGFVSTKDYNIVLNAYEKCIANYYNNKHLSWKRMVAGGNDNDRYNDQDNGDNDNVQKFDDGDDDNSNERTKMTSEFGTRFNSRKEEFIAITRAEDLVKRMKMRYENYVHFFPENVNDTNNTRDNKYRLDDRLPPKPDIVTYNILLSAYSNQYNNEDAVEKAEAIIELLQSSDEDLQADTITYNTLIDLYANQIGEYGYAQKAEDVLLYMSKLRKEGNDVVKPDTLTFNTVLKAWRNSGGGSIESAQRAEEILRLMIKLYLEGHSDVKPDGVSVSTVINAFTRPSSNIPSEVIISHLDRIIDLLLNETENFIQKEPQTIVRAFNTIIDNIAKSSIDDAGEKANYFIHKFIELSTKKDSPPELMPDHITYSNVIGAFVEAGDINNATQLLDRMIDDKHLGVPPNAYCFNKCLKYHCTMKVNQEAAETLFRKIHNTALEAGRIQNRSHAVIDHVTYCFMIQLYQNLFSMNPSNGKVYIDKAIDLINEMVEAYDAGILSKLDIYPYHIVIDLLQKDGQTMKNGNGFKAHELLMKAIRHFYDHKLDEHPATAACNFALSALSKECNKEAADKSSALIEHMEEMHGEGRNVRPDSHSFNHALVCWTRSGAENTAEKIKYLMGKMISQYEEHLDTGVFETALHGLSHNTRGDRKIAQELVEEMISLSKSKEKVRLSPTCLNLALKSECQEVNRNRNEMPAFGAHNLLFKYIKRHELGEIDTLPSNIGFNTVISSWSQAPHRDALHKAEEIYRQMKFLSQRKGFNYVKPDVYTYSNMLKVYSNSRNRQAAKRAENFVERILQEDNSNVDIYTYNGLLNVWAKGIDPEKAVHARKWLDEMIKVKKVDKLSYNIVLKACCQTRGTNEDEKVALDIALKTFNDTLSSKNAPPDYITFASAAKSIHHLCKDKETRKEHLKRIFEECCHRGMLNSLVVKELNHAIPLKDQVNFIGHELRGPFDKQWTRNL